MPTSPDAVAHSPARADPTLENPVARREMAKNSPQKDWGSDVVTTHTLLARVFNKPRAVNQALF
jgi:hypothetical protein